MPRPAAALDPRLSEMEFAASALAIAAARSLQALGEACHREILRLIGSSSVGLYALSEGVPRLVFSRQAATGFLDEYRARADRGDILIDRMCERGEAVDGLTEMGASLWRSSGTLDLLERWGYRHCMAGPIRVDRRVIGVVYTADPARHVPFGPALRRRMTLLCQAGSIAVESMIEAGKLGEEPRRWTDTAPLARPAPPPALAGLPRRAREVAVLVSQGRTNKEIARDLGLSVHTVKEYVGNLCRRLDAQNRTELAHRCTGWQ